MDRQHPATTDHQKRQVERYRDEYAVRRRRQAFAVIPVALLGLAGAVSGGTFFGMGQDGVMAAVGVVVLGLFGFSLVNWRCPSCGAYLGQRLNPKRCRSCGVEFRD